MRRRMASGGVAVFLGLGLLVQAVGAQENKPANAVLMPSASIKYGPVEGFPGLQMAVVEGDATKGPHHFLIKFPPGFAAPLHHHTADHYVTVVAGTLVLTVDGKEHKLGPGSYFAFTGKQKHLTRCEPGAECLLFVDVRGLWDIVPEAAAEAKK